jgi:hypothetical protein
MSTYISILLPAFYLKADRNVIDKDEIAKFCSIQFETPLDDFDLFELNVLSNNSNISEKRIDYAIKFKESDLSLNSIEDLIYQRDCIRAICEKTFESLRAMNLKLNDLQHEIITFNESGRDSEEIRKDLENDNLKLRDLLQSQVEYSDNFRMNTERTLNKIKEEFQTMVQELETMRRKTVKTKPTTSRDINSFNSSNTISGITKKKTNVSTNSISSSNNNNNLTHSKLTGGGGGVPKLNFINNNMKAD